MLGVEGMACNAADARDRRNAAPQRRQGVTFAGSGQIGADNFWHCRHGLVG
jgi:lysine/ornithine N-monooxygenase